MTVFIDIDHFVQLPSKCKITPASSQSNSQTQPDIVCHEDQHEEIAQGDLDNMKECLKYMMPITDSGPVNKKAIQPDLFENKTKINRKKQMRHSVNH